MSLPTHLLLLAVVALWVEHDAAILLRVSIIVLLLVLLLLLLPLLLLLARDRCVGQVWGARWATTLLLVRCARLPRSKVMVLLL